MQRFASIDLGTNTCNLLIADFECNELKTVVAEKRAILLLKNSGDTNYIGNEAIDRLISAITDYCLIMSEYKPDVIIANATSGIRSAENGNEILDLIKDKTGIGFKTISGEQEALLIHKGVLKAVSRFEKPVLLLDIGGGSNEFVIYNHNEIFWKHSYNIGISRLINTFSLKDPLSENNLIKVNELFDETLSALFQQLKKHPVAALVGSSGTFETLANIYAQNNKESRNQAKSSLIPYDDFKNIYQKLIHSNRNQRLAIIGMEPLRVDLIPLASYFVNYLVDKIGIELIIHSHYSIKEGAIFAHIENN